MSFCTLGLNLTDYALGLESLQQFCFNHPCTSNLKRGYIEDLRAKATAAILESGSAHSTTSSSSRLKITLNKTEYNFFDRPSGESSRRFHGWEKLRIIDDYDAFESYRRLPAAQKRGALALADDTTSV